MSFCPGKNVWPELVGAKGKHAESVIQHENRRVNAIIVREGSFVTHDFRCDRVRVFVDWNGRVTRIPMIG